MKSILLFALCFCVLSSKAQENSYEQIDTLLAKWDQKGAPGFAMGLMKGKELVYAKGFGAANLDYNIPNSPETVFRIASTSKQFTAACILLLEKQGLLHLDDSLTRFFPEFPAYAHKITVRHLLHHTSGVRDYLVLSYLAGMRDADYYTNEEIMGWLQNQQALNFEPGSEFTYSNSGYWLLSQIVEKASGKTLAEFAGEHLFKPLKMDNTHFHDNTAAIVKNRATGYSIDEEGNFIISETTLPMVGDGGIFTTINDFSKWIGEYHSQSVLGKDFWEKMLTVGKLSNGEATEYACGLMVHKYKGLNMISHGGSFVGFRSSFILFPDEKLAIVVLANRNDISPGQISNDVAKLFLKDKMKEDKAPKKEADQKATELQLSAEELEQFTGEYELQPGVDFSVSIKNDSLNILQKWNSSSYAVIPVAENTFSIPNIEGIYFEFSEINDGKANMVIVTQGGEGTPCKRKSANGVSLAALEEYVGNYYSPELLVTYHISVVNDTLWCKMKSNDVLALTPSSKDVFTLSGIVFHFNRTEGIVDGFAVDAGRVKGIEFKRE